MDFELLSVLAVNVAGIAVVVGLLFFILKVSLSPDAYEWLFKDHPWLVNIGVVVASVSISILGAWLNWESFEMRSVAEYIWRGMWSAGIGTLGYEFSKNVGREVFERMSDKDE